VKPLLFGAVLALVWLLFGSPLGLVETALVQIEQPVILAFAAGVLARPHLMGRRTT
jgi:hypothetical protein